MLTERDHRARLRPFGALGVLRDETHLITNGEAVEVAIGNAVAVEIDLVAVGALDNPAIPRRK